MVTLVDTVLTSVKYEEQAYNSCKGILHMCKYIPNHIEKSSPNAFFNLK